MKLGYPFIVLLAAALTFAGCGNRDREQAPTGTEIEHYGVHALHATPDATVEQRVSWSWQDAQLNLARWRRIAKVHDDPAPLDTMLDLQALTIAELEQLAKGHKFRLPANTAAKHLEPAQDFEEIEHALRTAFHGLEETENMLSLIQVSVPDDSTEGAVIWEGILGRTREQKRFLEEALAELLSKALHPDEAS